MKRNEKEEATPMNSALKQRLEALQSEYEAGQKMLAELQAKQQSLTSTMLRIEGAMQVLREMITEESSASGSGDAGPKAAAG